MMQLMGLINLDVHDSILGALTLDRPLAAVPFAGRYRLIDFTLSNIVNSRVSTVGIFIHHKYRSLMDHLRSGKEWDLARSNGGLYILPPSYVSGSTQLYRGDLENFQANFDFLRNCEEKYVIVTGAGFIANLNYRDVLDFHCETGADVTVIYTKAKTGLRDNQGAYRLQLDRENNVAEMGVFEQADDEENICMEMFLLERSLLLELVNNCLIQGNYNFIKHCIIQNCQRLKVKGYEWRGYVGRIASLESYFERNMDILQPDIWHELFFNSNLVYTKVKNEPPAKYYDTAEVHNSLIASGCCIEGKVENSILFRGVKVKKGAVIKNSIVMQKGKLGENVVLENIICDKEVNITENKHLKGERNYPLVIKKGCVI